MGAADRGCRQMEHVDRRRRGLAGLTSAATLCLTLLVAPAFAEPPVPAEADAAAAPTGARTLPVPTPVGDTEAEELAADGLFIELRDGDAPVPHSIYVSATLRTPPRALWKLLHDYGSFSDYQPQITYSKARYLSERSGILDYRISVLWPFPDVAGRTQIDVLVDGQATGSGVVHYRCVTGMMEGVTGRIAVEPYGDGDAKMTVEYVADEPGLFPDFMTRWFLALVVPDGMQRLEDESNRRIRTGWDGRPAVARSSSKSPGGAVVQPVALDR